MRLLYPHMQLATCTCISSSEIEDIAGMEFDKLIQQVHLGKLNVVDLRTNERLDMSKELLGVVLAPADDTLRMFGMPCELSKTVFPHPSTSGVVITLTYHAHQHFTYLNSSLIWMNFQLLLAPEVWISKNLLQ